MRRTARFSLTLLAAALLVAGCRADGNDAPAEQEAAAEAPEARRFVEGNVLTSTDLPPIRVRVDPAFTYAGTIDFILRDIARVERYVFVDADERRHVRRLVIFQFEGFLDGVDETYRYRFPDPVVLGGYRFKHNTWFYDDLDNIAANPGAESDRTRAFLEGSGYTLDAQWMMSRFVTVADDARRHELILFYIESIRAAGHTLEEIAEDGDVRPAFAALDSALTERSLRHLTVLDGAPASSRPDPIP